MSSVIPNRKGTTFFGSCPCPAQEGVCNCSKVTDFEMLGVLSGGHAVVYSEWTGKPHTCRTSVDTCELQTTEACIKSICSE